MKEPPDKGPHIYTVWKGADCDALEIAVGTLLALALVAALVWVLVA